jgi:hypothetical protein
MCYAYRFTSMIGISSGAKNAIPVGYFKPEIIVIVMNTQIVIHHVYSLFLAKILLIFSFWLKTREGHQYCI